MKSKITAILCVLSILFSGAYAAPIQYGERESNPNLVLPENPKMKMENGTLSIEGEDMLLSKDMTVISDTEASGGQAIKVTASAWAGTLDQASEERSFYVETTATESGNYAVWLRVKCVNDGANSVWGALNSDVYSLYEYAPENNVYDSEYHWLNVGYAMIKQGSFHISFKYRELNFTVDKMIVTLDKSFKPVGMNDVPGMQGESQTYDLYPEPEIKPIAQHPRLLVTEDMIPTLRSNMQTEELNTMYNIAAAYAAEDLSGAISAAAGGYNTAVETKIEARALMYLLGEHNKEQARKTIDYAREYLEAVDYNSAVQDITREVGYAMMMGAVVYDWCYDLLTDDDKDFFPERLKELAAKKEIGYPPTKPSSIGSHSGEYEIMRDMISVGIAVYDEDPEMYNLAAGRFFSEYIESRKMFNQSGNHPQGNSYGAFRFECELWAELIFSRMGYSNVFGEGMEEVAYKWIYERLPFGAWFKDGDDTAISKYSYFNYSNYDLRTQILSGNMFNNPILKRQYLKEMSLCDYNPSFIWLLVIADPSIGAEEVNDLPLARKTTYPLSGIIARTSWQTGLDAPTAMAQMKIQEKNLGDHMHLDSGTFQIYYKGSLAVASGLYEGKTGGWGSAHYNNYYRRTISHNAITALDPDENVYPAVAGSSNDGGQKLVASGVVETYDALMDIGDLAETKGSYIGPNEYTPKFSYIKGDITNAYSDKISAYNRSMVFMDLFDEDYPAAFVVFDRVDTSNKDFKKTWLMHSMEEPTVEDNITTICRTENGFNGKLVNKTMLPAKAEITKMKGFSVNGVEYPNGEYDGINSEGAEWRVEVSPAQQSKNDIFLNAMYVTDADRDLPTLDMQMLQNGMMTGVAVKDRIVMFSNNAQPIGRAFSATIPESDYETVSCMLADITPGMWNISGGNVDIIVEVKEDESALYFEGGAGVYRISPVGNAEATELSYPRQPKAPIGDFLIYQNGMFLNQPEPTKEIDNAAYTPIRGLIEDYGAKLDWNPDTSEVTVTNEFGKIMTFKNGQTECVIDAEASQLAHAPVLIDGHTYICLSDFDDFLMIQSKYDSYAKILKVNITDRETLRLLDGVEIYTPAAVTASENDGNLPENAADMDFTTRWSAQGDLQWLMYDLGEEKEIGKILLATFRGTTRALSFSVELSNDGVNFTEVYKGSASGTTDGLEEFTFDSASARYVRLKGYANNKDKWNSVTELIAAK